MFFKIFLLVNVLHLVFTTPAFNILNAAYNDERDIHNILAKANCATPAINPEEKSATYWTNQAQSVLRNKLEKKLIKGIAKNIILFLGDGMSISTLTAARIYLGQKKNQPGPENMQLSFEKFPFVGLAKTYCVDNQVADSACSATAYLSGVKGNFGTIGVSAGVKLFDCNSMVNASNKVYSIGRWAQLKNKRTGIVTTTKLTDASPAGMYAHTASRLWENDRNVMLTLHDPRKCTDIATQLIHGETGKNINVILGGGRNDFLPRNSPDGVGTRGSRFDGHNLIKEWKSAKRSFTHRYVVNKAGLLSVGNDTEYLLGLFAESHIDYNLDRDPIATPSLAEMTESAINVLSRGKNGYFLFVESGRIDQAHHQNMAKKALDETVELHKAVEMAINMTNPEDTLIVVISDHSHSMGINGHPNRGNDILGIAGLGLDLLPYTTISYGTGPGYKWNFTRRRHDVSKDNLGGNEYSFPTIAPVPQAMHGGDDVAIFAYGPWAHLFSGVNEQNILPHIMAYASCVGDGATVCDRA